MEVMSEKTRCNGQDKKGKKTTKVELNLGKNGGFFILFGGALVTALISSAFRKQRKPREKDENHRGSPPAAAEENGEAGDEQKNNISDGEDPVSDDEDPVRKGLQFILSDPSSLMQDHLRIGEGDYNVSKEMNETEEKDGSVLKMQASEEQDSPASGCHQEIISNDSSIPGSATSSEQEYSSQPFYTHPLFEQATLIKEGTLHTEEFRVAKAEETMKAALEEEVKDVVPAEQEEMECSEKNCSPEIEMDLRDGQNGMNSSPEMMQRNDEHRGVGDDDDDQKNTNSEQVTSEITHLQDCEINVQNLELAAFHVSSHIKHSNEVSTTTKENGNTNEPASAEQNLFVVKQHCDDYCKGGIFMVDEKALGHSSMEKEGEEVEETNPYIQFAEKKLHEDGYTGDIDTGKKYPILPSNDKEGDETDDGDECDYDDECDYGDGDDDISEETDESSEGGGISSDDDVAIWPAEPVEDDGTLKTEAYINFKTINSSKLQTTDCRGDLKMNSIQNSPRKLVFLDNLVAYSLESKRRILAGTVTLLIAYLCFWYFELPFLKPSLVVIAAMFLSKVLAV